MQMLSHVRFARISYQYQVLLSVAELILPFSLLFVFNDHNATSNKPGVERNQNANLQSRHNRLPRQLVIP